MVIHDEYFHIRFRIFCDAFVFKEGTIHEHFELSQQIALLWSIYSEEEKLALLHKDVTSVLDPSEQTVFKQYFAVNVAHTLYTPKTTDQAIQYLYLTGKYLKSDIPTCQHERFCICLEHYDADMVCSMLQSEININQGNHLPECDQLQPLLYAGLSAYNLDAHYIETYRKLPFLTFCSTFIDATSLQNRLSKVIQRYFESTFRVNQYLSSTETKLADHIVLCFSPAQVVREALNNNLISSAKYFICNYHVPEHYYVLKPLSRAERIGRIGLYPKARPLLKFSESMDEWCHEDSKVIRTPESDQPFFDVINDDSALKYIILMACKDGLGFFLSVRFVCKRWFNLLTIQEVLQSQAESAIDNNCIIDEGLQFYLEHAYSQYRKIEIILEYLLYLNRIPRSRNIWGLIYIKPGSLFLESIQVSCPKLTAKALYNGYLIFGNKLSALSKSLSFSPSFLYEMLKNLHLNYHGVLREFLSTNSLQTKALEIISDFGGDDDELCKAMVHEVLNSLAHPSDLKCSIIIEQWAFRKYSEQVMRHLGIVECTFKEALRCFHALDFKFDGEIIPAICKLVIEDFATTKSIDIDSLRTLSPIDLMVALFKSNHPSELMSELMHHLHVDYYELLDALIKQSDQ